VPPVEFQTLGPIVTAWIEENCVIPDGEAAGEPYLLTGEMKRFVDAFYAVDVTNRRWAFPRGGQLIRPQKWGKGPFSAALICAEAVGPVLPDWRDGELVGGRSWRSPWIQVTAVSEDQTANVFSALHAMIDLSPRLGMSVPNTGQTRIFLPGGGVIEPVTASSRSRLGQRITAAVQDQSESWVQSNNGWMLADNQRRGLAGMGGRFLETCNAPDPVENSVAYRTPREPGVFVDDVDGGPGSIRNKAERRKVLRKVYGDSTVERGGWVDLDRIDAEIEALLEHDPAQAERFFLNRKLASEGAAFDIEQFVKLAKPRTPAKGETIVVGVDGARYEDAIAVVATEVKSGYQWPLAVVERPDDAPDDYEHDFARVDAAVNEAFERWNVWRVYIDPQRIDRLVEGWSNRHGEKRIVEWQTYRPRPIAWAVRKYEQAIASGDVSHDGSEVLVRHVRNARKRVLTVLDDKERPMHTLTKDHVRSPRKIDAAMAAVLSWEARGDAIEAGAVWMGDETARPEPPKPKPWEPGRAFDTRVLQPASPVGPMGALS
jgi:hypothetical protein